VFCTYDNPFHYINLGFTDSFVMRPITLFSSNGCGCKEKNLLIQLRVLCSHYEGGCGGLDFSYEYKACPLK